MLNYLILPKAQSEFECEYLGRMNRIATWFFIAHLPVFVLIAWLNETQPMLAFVLTSATLAGPLFARFSLKSPRLVAVVMGITAMLMGGLLVHFGQGPVQIEMHFYFFVLLALLAVFANPMVIIAAAATVALHHALLWLLIPASVFNYDAPLWVVAVHSAFVVLESVAACFIARSFYDNVIGLERKVNQRTLELRNRGQEMRRLLDSVHQGFFSVTCDGCISEERSRAANSLLEIDSMLSAHQGLRFSDVLRSYDPTAADWFEMGIEDVFAGILPLEVTLDQLPKRCVVSSRSLMIEYSPVLEGDSLTGLAVTVSDVTAEVERQKLAQENRDLLSIFEHVAKDSTRVQSFVRETEVIISTLRSVDLDTASLARLVHTLKGNSAAFGLEYITKACHDIEDVIADGCQPFDSPAWSNLFDGWEIASKNIHRFMKTESDCITVQRAEYDSLLNGLASGTPRVAIAQCVRNWTFERISKQIDYLSEHARVLAGKLNKQVLIHTEDCGLRMDMARWSEFWSGLCHVVRNALDHGIESSKERQSVGKPAAGTLTFRSQVIGEQFCLSISDDGRGLDWQRIREIATQCGLQAESEQDLINAIFMDGVSTAERITHVSGRGIGMAAVKHFTEKMGGCISVCSRPQQGVEFRFSFPLAALTESAQTPSSPILIVDGAEGKCNYSEVAEL